MTRFPLSTRAGATLLLCAALPLGARAQEETVERWRLVLQDVLPAAERFTDKEGTPPLFHGYGTDPSGRETLVGYAFLTSDFPPEEPGYNGPIQVMVGMAPRGMITGARVVRYRESLMVSRGDFLRRRGFQEQFAGKSYADAFRVRRDVDGISGATITVGAMTRGMRNAIRRVAAANLAAARTSGSRLLEVADLRGLTWSDLVVGGHAQRVTVLDAGLVAIDVSLFYLMNEQAGRVVMGPDAFAKAQERVGERAATDHLMMVGVDGPLAALFRPQAMRLVQGDDTLKMVSGDVILLGPPTDGMIDGEFRNAGLMLVDTVVDMDDPFTIVVDLRPGLGLFTAEYPGRRVTVAAAPQPAPDPAEAPPATDDAAESATADADPSEPEATAESDAPPLDPPAPEVETAVPVQVPISDAPIDLGFVETVEETILARTLADTSWARVGLLLALLALVSFAFFTKLDWLRWSALAATFALLGFGGGGFLSVSHIISGIKVGPSAYLNDLPLLLLVSFTLVTTLLWGRVFCGFLCPFGVLQDFLERIVPRRFQRELPRALHERAAWVKYGVLVVVLAPALAGSDLIIFQYFEPFGTVFFFSPSVLLWVIAGGFLAATVLVPRFYCRYVCPLGASLALASLVSPFRIKRVEQCDVCTVCSRVCPTRAIAGPRLDFKECVRCNICEIKLIEKAGVCRHDIEEIRPRLVTITVGAQRRMADVH